MEVLQCILDRGQLDIEKLELNGCSALHYAAHYNNFKACKVLLENGANARKKNWRGATPLTLALGSGPISPEVTVRVLLEFGANASDTYEDYTALRRAIAWPSRNSAKLLIKRLAITEHLNSNIDKSDRQIIENDDVYREHYEICLQELQDMRRARIYNNVSVHDIFMQSDNVIAGYAKNEELVEAFESQAYKARFPIYFRFFSKRFRRIVGRQRLQGAAAKTL